MNFEDPASVSDEALARSWKAGDEMAFEILYRRYRVRLVAFFYRFVMDRGLAEDLAQETFLHGQRGIRGYDPTRKFSNWLFAIAANLGRDHARKMRRRWTVEGVGAPAENGGLASTPPVLDEVLKRELEAEVKRAMTELSEEHRLVLLLRHYHGLSYQEIAEILGCPLGTVKSRMHCSIHALKEWLTKKGLV